MSAEPARKPSRRAAHDAGARPSVAPQPFLKWAGGKRALLTQLRDHVPRGFRGTYHEPFIGGGALFFDLRPERAVLCDVNERLVRTWRTVRDHVDALVERLRVHERRHNQRYYYEQRAREIDDADDLELAAWLIYLNKTAFNGLYRVNRKNGFNVPIGRYAKPNICDAERLRACAHALRDTELHARDFAAVLDHATPGDFVYFDPPYVPLSPTASFTTYSQDGFGLPEHERLRDVARELKRRGVHVLLSNSWTPVVEALYAGDDFELRQVFAPRAINSNASRRGGVHEVLVW